MTLHKNLETLSQIDYTSAAEINAGGHLLVSLLQHYGAFSYPVAQSPEIKKIRVCCETWLCKTANGVAALPSHQSLQALSFYDLLHRVIFARPGTDLVDRQFERAFQTYLGGDTRVDEITLMQTIDNGLRFGNPAYTGSPRVWFDKTISLWFKEIRHKVESGSHTPSAPDFDKAALLLGQDLSTFTQRQQLVKEQISRYYLVLCAGDPSSDGVILLSMLRFVSAALNLSPLNDRIAALRQQLIALLSATPTLPAADRTAFALDLSALTPAQAV